ncbi:MAG: non-heme iron oxygenase ferredoxin subunit [Gammaproteobacteria bacterium]|nr:non-heme iron oxygenase ferredoxin subunit [Gammaproteobacteria bacterium]
MAEWVEVAPVDDFPPGTWKVVDVQGVMVAVFNVDGEYYAIEDVCTHDGSTLTGGKLEGDVIECPRHGARFSVRTGAVLAPPAYEPVPTLRVRVHDGKVQVMDDRWE